VAEDRANPQLALRRSARSRSAEPIQRASWDALPKNRTGKLHRRALRESLAAAEASQGCGPGARRG
jgi:acyl-coenzyme A synthetase/AMP-(fatty) acid ligase